MHMPSNLFQKATQRERRSTRSKYARSPMQRMARDVAKLTKGTTGKANIQAFSRAMLRPEVNRMLREFGRMGPNVTKYAASEDGRKKMDKLLGYLGPVGEVIRSVVTKGNGNFTNDSLQAATNMIRAFGGEVLVKKGGRGYDRGLAAAKQLLEEEGYTVEKRDPDQVSHQSEGPRHLDRELMTPTDWIYDPEVRVDSSSVYSYAFSQETESFGTLYVTFLAWTPGTGKTSAAGATYAYHQVELSRYQGFKREASRSAGEAVWDYLRVRGTVHGHQVPYELVGGVQVQDGGVYIPRKAASRGLFRRAVQRQGAARGDWRRSSLPSREFQPNRAEPNRGRPNRGR